MKTIIFDTETTGLLLPSTAPLEKQPRIIEFGAVELRGAEVVERHNIMINPGQPITDEITKITGIRNEELVGMPAFSDVADHIMKIMSGAHYWIAHNAPFDHTMLMNEFRRMGWEEAVLPRPVELICTAQEFTPMVGKRPRLIELYERIMGEPLAQTHRAIDDAWALAQVVIKSNMLEVLLEEAQA